MSSGTSTRTPSIASSIIDLVNPHTPQNGLNLGAAVIFIIGSICGGGLLAIPQAIVDCGAIGPIALIACGGISSFTGYLLGKCWTVLRIRYPEYNSGRITDPYPTIAFRAGGKIANIATRICIDVTLFGGGTVFLLLISGNISQLIHDLGNKDFSLCYVMLIATAVLIPFTWLGTPKDFWQVAAVAAGTSVLAAVFVFVSLMVSIPDHDITKHRNPDFPGFFNAFGTILFAFGGASCFPTIQVDMKRPQNFPKAVIMGICSVMTVYLMVGVPGYVIIGDDMEPNILNALKSGWISTTVNFLITSHLLMAFVIVTNPVAQEIEGFFKVPDKFGWKRIAVRSSLTAASMFVGLTIPHFNVILSILGGSTIACTNFIFPPLFYYKLSKQTDPSKAYGYQEADPTNDLSIEDIQSPLIESEEGKNWPQIHIPLHIKVLLFEIMGIGIVGGFSSTFFSFASLINGNSGFTVPCYVDAGVGMPT